MSLLLKKKDILRVFGSGVSHEEACDGFKKDLLNKINRSLLLL